MTEPTATEPAATDPGATDPGATGSGDTHPTATEPAAIELGATDPGDTVPVATDSEASDPAAVSSRRLGRRDELLDLIRSVAIVRVVLWHTWSWAWLTWVPAMPAMFFSTGALLDASLRRRGWVATVRQRCRRLLLPYWVYAAACWGVMLLSGWRPTAGEAFAWLVPLADPVGSAELPGLWVPLWYVRAHLWFVLGAGIIGVVVRRLGWSAVVVASALGVGVFWLGRAGTELPMAVGDAAAYLPFVAAGMLYGAGRRLPGRLALGSLGLAAAVASMVIWQRLGPLDGIVNRSYLLTMTVGAAGVALVLAWRAQLETLSGRWRSVVGRINSRALTIYLWQGFGLVAAQRLVDARVDAPVPAALLSLLVVAVVIAAAVALFGGLEDLAAGRERRQLLVPRPLALPGVALVVAALVIPMPAGATVEAPLSGQAVVARAAQVEADLAGDDAPARPDVSGLTPQEVLDGWVEEHAARLDEIDTNWVDAVVVSPDGTVTSTSWSNGTGVRPEVLAWWSMTKAVTAAWFVTLVEQGVVQLDDPLSRWVPETPRADDMTLEQLARHTAGVPEDLSRHIFDADPRDEIDEFIERGELGYEPGEGYGYSRVGYYLLALALERASGVPYTDAVDDMARRAGVDLQWDDDEPESQGPDAQGPAAQGPVAQGPGGQGPDGQGPVAERPTSQRPITDPDGHGYRGGPWSSGGLASSLDQGARFVHWLFDEGLSKTGVDMMARFSSDPDRIYYGLGLIPLCPPCEPDGEWIRAERVGLDTATGLFGVDRATGAVVMIQTDNWWAAEGPEQAFYDLQHRLLDTGGEAPAG
jgi:CubicO group peptidase (beta-lactamase class C family)/fucose 4-O-acetylase-like acetyltransferase